ncbi:hypothetical protein ADEAN_000273000 [Angomonas deanei]|uniref:Uncharacterized protein n=1 Tax=Angomonas deanei TaxID=59799 RepID=A0A7G2C728_9TRYP|nr:hypothetical protein ADEAN_000273000 [Angomonas deanei]
MRSYRSELPKDLQQLIASTEEGVERLYRATDPSSLRKKQRKRRNESYDDTSTSSYEAAVSDRRLERPSFHSASSHSYINDSNGRVYSEATPLKPSSKINVISVNSSGTKTTENTYYSDAMMKTEFGQRWTNTYRNLVTPNTSAQPSPDTSPKSGLPPPSIQRTPPPLQPSPASPEDRENRDKGTQRLLDTINTLKEEIREKEKNILEVKLTHANEMATLRESIVTCRSEAAKEVAEQLSVSYAVKQSLLQSTLEAESQRVADLEAELRTLKKEKDSLRSELEERKNELLLYSKTSQLGETNTQVAYEKVAQLEQYVEELKRNHLQHLREMETVEEEKRRLCERETELCQEVENLKAQIESQKGASNEAITQLEEEFNATAANYQQLLSDTSTRMSYLEKVERKYKSLKRDMAALTEEKEAVVDQYSQQVTSLEEENDKLNKEVVSLKERLILAEDTAEEVQEEHKREIDRLTRQVEIEKHEGEEKVKSVTQQLETANHTIELLKARLEGMQEEIMEETHRAQNYSMKATEEKMKLDQLLNEQKQKAVQFKAQSDEIVASLKRQLKEKDAKLKVLATSSDEPLQRLRQQLESERSRRARLEEQFSTYKKKARDAEEKAVLELRKEQLRHSAELAMRSPSAARSSPSETFTPKPASEVYRQRLAVDSATSTPKALTTIGRLGAMRENNNNPPIRNSYPGRRNMEQKEIDQRSPPQVQTTSIGNSAPRPVRREMDSPLSAVHAGTVESLSDISKTSPWHSRADNDTSLRSVPAGRMSPTHSPVVRRIVSPVPQDDETALVGEQVMHNAGVSSHERKLNDYRVDAADIFRKITGSRDEFLTQCISLVKRTGAEYADKKRKHQVESSDESEMDSTQDR